MDGTNLIAEIEEVTTELGEPDCKLIEPHVVQEYKNGSPQAKFTFKPWLLDITFQNEFMISSDKILICLIYSISARTRAHRGGARGPHCSISKAPA